MTRAPLEEVLRDRTLPYATVVELMDACRVAGVERIGVLTKRP